MKSKFVPVEHSPETVDSARERVLECFDWACVAVDVDGGFMCFESADDYSIWMNQA